MKKLILIFFFTLSLFGAKHSNDYQGNMEHLYKVLGVFVDSAKLKPRDVIFFYNSFIDPIESNVELSKSTDELFNQFGVQIVSSMMIEVEKAYYAELYNVISEHPAVIPSSKKTCLEALKDSEKQCNGAQRDLRIAFSQDKKTLRDFQYSFTNVMQEIEKAIKKNSSYFFKEGSEVVQNLDRDSIASIVLLYLIKDRFYNEVVQIHTVERPTIKRQLDIILAASNEKGSLMPKQQYNSPKEFLEDLAVKESILMRCSQE